jgi:hypothetical protein
MNGSLVKHVSSCSTSIWSTTAESKTLDKDLNCQDVGPHPLRHAAKKVRILNDGWVECGIIYIQTVAEASRFSAPDISWCCARVNTFISRTLRRGWPDESSIYICRCDGQTESINSSVGAKTYNSGDSLVVTHLTTNPPVSCLSKAERTGSPVFKILWSYVEKLMIIGI